MLCSNHFSFPVKEGEFIFLETLPNILQYGIYKCEIIPSNNEEIDKLFRFNSKSYYTHYDIKLAIFLKLKIELVMNDGCNALIYSKNRASGSEYFGQIVHSLYELKKSSKLAKKILNALWGALCQKNKIIKTTRKELNFDNNEYIVSIEPFGDINKVAYLIHGKFFKHNYARLGVFLTSAVRKQMAEIIYPFKGNVFRCHTDSILSNKELPLVIGPNLGEFHIDKQGKANIKNSCIVQWED
jgi:hypothetical protein